jgi:hypothetical protein
MPEENVMKPRYWVATMGLAAASAGVVYAGALWEAPQGPTAGEEVPPVLDRDAGARRRITEARTRPATASSNPSKMWNAPSLSPHVERKGTILDVSAEATLKGLEPTRVSVAIQSLAAESALEELATAVAIPMRTQQAGLLRQMGTAPVTLELKDVPLLEALLEFNSQTALSIREMTTKRIALIRNTDNSGWGAPGPGMGIPPGTGVGIWCISGPFAVVLESLQSSVDLRRGNAAAETTMTVAFLAEPKLNVVEYPHYLHIDAAVDDLGQSVEITPPVDDRRPRQANEHRLVLPLRLPDSPGQKLQILRGTADFSLAQGVERIEVSDPAAGLHKPTNNGITVEVVPIPRGAGTGVSLTVRYHRDALDEDLWRKLSGPLQDLVPQVMTVSGQPYSTVIGNSRMPDADTVELQRTYIDSGGDRNAAGPDKILIDVPVGIRQIHVPFEFKNLVLP